MVPVLVALELDSGSDPMSPPQMAQEAENREGLGLKNEAMAAEWQMKQLGHNCTYTDTRMKGFNCAWQEQEGAGKKPGSKKGNESRAD